MGHNLKQTIKIMESIALTSCHLWVINCGKDLLEIERKYNELADKARDDDEQLKGVLRAKAKELEELTQKEIHKALRSRLTGEQAKLELGKELELGRGTSKPAEKKGFFNRQQKPAPRTYQRAPARTFVARKSVTTKSILISGNVCIVFYCWSNTWWNYVCINRY